MTVNRDCKLVLYTGDISHQRIFGFSPHLAASGGVFSFSGTDDYHAALIPSSPRIRIFWLPALAPYPYGGDVCTGSQIVFILMRTN